MKARLQKNLTGIILVCILFPSISVHSQSQRMKDKFYTGFFHFPYLPHFYDTTYSDYYKQLSVNMMQGYGTSGDHDGSNLIGGFYDSLSWYYPNVSNMLYTFSAGLGDNSMLLSRSKISRPAYGQRSTYEAEYGRVQLVNGSTKPGYGYKHGVSNYYAGELWQGETVSGRYCITGQQSAQYIVDSLYENMEQVNNLTTDILLSDRKDSSYRWYVKPRMRIDQSFANNSANWDKIVVKIEVNNFDGSTNTPINILVRNFLDPNDYYDGSYKEYYNFTSSPYPLSVLATDLTQGATANINGLTDDIESSRVDFRVYWLGEVDVWLDYVRVDDEWAHFLFNPQLDIPNNPRRYFFNYKITEEINAFGNHTGFGYFYIDEYSYNNLPAIAEVNRIIKQNNPNTGLVSVFCPECSNNGLRNGVEDERFYFDL